ncbi:MAG: rhamnulokinase family protein [Terriglobia bacterium]
MNLHRFLAFDLGAESGRAVVGTLQEGQLALEEISRFLNEPVPVQNTLYWDVLALHNNILKGMREYAGRYGDAVDGVGIDTWGVDFGLLSKSGELLQNPVHYRDRRTAAMLDKVRSRIAPEELFRQTGVTLVPINTSVQLLSLRLNQNALLDSASSLLLMPDLLAYFLTGRQCCERTNAVTTQLYDPWERRWHEGVMGQLDLPLSILPELVDPATILGELLDSVSARVGLKRGLVIAPCTHDTASAVAAVPAEGADWAFLSSGTWSVVGALTPEVVTSPEAYAAGMFNELTLQSYFLCRNTIGLWLLQQARAGWQRAGKVYAYEDLVRLAEQGFPGGPLIYPNDARFLAPPDMFQAIRDYCAETGQSPPEGPGETTRCILESSALAYRQTLDQLTVLLGRKFRVVHVVGGGSKNSLLCQLTADAAGIPVLAGPVEATVAGNVLVQALAIGGIKSAEEIRAVVRSSSTLIEYEPRDTQRWQDYYGKYLRLAERTKA